MKKENKKQKETKKDISFYKGKPFFLRRYTNSDPNVKTQRTNKIKIESLFLCIVKVSSDPIKSYTMSNPNEHLMNSLHFVNTAKMLKEDGMYVWIDTGFRYKRKGNKMLCNKKAFTAMSKITGGLAKSILHIDEQMENVNYE